MDKDWGGKGELKMSADGELSKRNAHNLEQKADCEGETQEQYSMWKEDRLATFFIIACDNGTQHC